jgi:hypothetical protein
LPWPCACGPLGEAIPFHQDWSAQHPPVDLLPGRSPPTVYSLHRRKPGKGSTSSYSAIQAALRDPIRCRHVQCIAVPVQLTGRFPASESHGTGIALSVPACPVGLGFRFRQVAARVASPGRHALPSCPGVARRRIGPLLPGEAETNATSANRSSGLRIQSKLDARFQQVSIPHGYPVQNVPGSSMTHHRQQANGECHEKSTEALFSSHPVNVKMQNFVKESY